MSANPSTEPKDFSSRPVSLPILFDDALEELRGLLSIGVASLAIGIVVDDDEAIAQKKFEGVAKNEKRRIRIRI